MENHEDITLNAKSFKYETLSQAAKINIDLLLFNILTVLQVYNVIYFTSLFESTDPKAGVISSIKMLTNSLFLFVAIIIVFANLFNKLVKNNYSIPIFLVFLVLLSNILFYWLLVLPTLFIIIFSIQIHKKTRNKTLPKLKKNNLNSWMLLINYCIFFILLISLTAMSYYSHPDIFYRKQLAKKLCVNPESMEEFELYLNTFKYGARTVDKYKEDFVENIWEKHRVKPSKVLASEKSMTADYALSLIYKMRKSSANTTIIVDEIVYIPPTLMFVVPPGITLKFKENTGIICEGAIEANGTKENPIIFDSENEHADWHGILVKGSYEFSYCTFKNINIQNTVLTNVQASPIYIYRSKRITISFNNCSFLNNKGYLGGALYFRIPTQYELTNCNFVGNEALNGGAIYVGGENEANKPTILLRDCIFKDNVAYAEGADIFFDFKDLRIAPKFINTQAKLKQTRFPPW